MSTHFSKKRLVVELTKMFQNTFCSYPKPSEFCFKIKEVGENYLYTFLTKKPFNLISQVTQNFLFLLYNHIPFRQVWIFETPCWVILHHPILDESFKRCLTKHKDRLKQIYLQEGPPLSVPRGPLKTGLSVWEAL